jgi:glycosyltransferase involved in cell wall biosynthesis
VNVFFDCRFIRIGHHDGISRFSAELFRALSTTRKLTALIYDERQLAALPAGANYLLVNDPTKAIAEYFLPLKLNRVGADLVYSPMQTMGSSFRQFKLILTLHDLIYYRHKTPPPAFSPWVKLAWRLYHLSYFPARVLLNKADAVVTISQTSKGLIQKHRLTNKPLAIVPNASGSNETTTKRVFPTKDKQLLYMGSFMEYKNVECLVAGMSFLPDFKLVLLSKIESSRKSQLEAQIDKAGGKVEFQNGVSDDDYLKLLDNAFALVSASKDEGFGIPVIEAAARGTPVVVSDIPIFHEVGSSQAIYFDPDQPGNFASKILELNDEKKWLETSSAVRQRSKDFSWMKSAKELDSLITGLLE